MNSLFLACCLWCLMSFLLHKKGNHEAGLVFLFLAICLFLKLVDSFIYSMGLTDIQYQNIIDSLLIGVIELYIFFRLPFSDFFWKNKENAANLKYRLTRLISAFALILILNSLSWLISASSVISLLIRINFFYFIFGITSEIIIHFCLASADERKQILQQQLSIYAKYGKTGLTVLAIAMIVLTFIARRLIPF